MHPATEQPGLQIPMTAGHVYHACKASTWLQGSARMALPPALRKGHAVHAKHVRLDSTFLAAAGAMGLQQWTPRHVQAAAPVQRASTFQDLAAEAHLPPTQRRAGHAQPARRVQKATIGWAATGPLPQMMCSASPAETALGGSGSETSAMAASFLLRGRPASRVNHVL